MRNPARPSDPNADKASESKASAQTHVFSRANPQVTYAPPPPKAPKPSASPVATKVAPAAKAPVVAPQHEMVPSWLQPFTMPPNTRFTRTPDYLMRQPVAAPQPEAPATATAIVAPPRPSQTPVLRVPPRKPPLGAAPKPLIVAHARRALSAQPEVVPAAPAAKATPATPPAGPVPPSAGPAAKIAAQGATTNVTSSVTKSAAPPPVAPPSAAPAPKPVAAPVASMIQFGYDTPPVIPAAVTPAAAWVPEAPFTAANDVADVYDLIPLEDGAYEDEFPEEERLLAARYGALRGPAAPTAENAPLPDEAPTVEDTLAEDTPVFAAPAFVAQDETDDVASEDDGFEDEDFAEETDEDFSDEAEDDTADEDAFEDDAAEDDAPVAALWAADEEAPAKDNHADEAVSEASLAPAVTLGGFSGYSATPADLSFSWPMFGMVAVSTAPQAQAPVAPVAPAAPAPAPVTAAPAVTPVAPP